jgi:hypothetical protein
MSLQTAIEVVTKLTERKVVRSYAIAEAVAALNYVQPTFTEDLDILVSVGDFEMRQSGLILLTPIEQALAGMGYAERTDVGYLIEDWPVQFLPAASALDVEGLEQAVDVEIRLTADTVVQARCLRAEHVVATAVKVGRLKDLARIEAFLNQRAVDLPALKDVLVRHGLAPAWKAFCAKAGIVDPLELT